MNVGNFVPSHVMKYYEEPDSESNLDSYRKTREPYKALHANKSGDRLMHNDKWKTQVIELNRTQNRSYKVNFLNTQAQPLQNIMKYVDNQRNIQDSWKNLIRSKQGSEKPSPFATKIERDLKKYRRFDSFKDHSVENYQNQSKNNDSVNLPTSFDVFNNSESEDKIKKWKRKHKSKRHRDRRSGNLANIHAFRMNQINQSSNSKSRDILNENLQQMNTWNVRLYAYLQCLGWRGQSAWDKLE